MSINQTVGWQFGHLIFRKKVLLPVLAIVLLLVITALIKTSLLNPQASTTVSAQAIQKTTVASPKATMPINKDFSFSVKDSQGNEVGTIKYLVDNAEKRDEILVQGQKATAIAGHTFLILNLKLTNDNKQKVVINARDFLRLSINGSSELLAPDIHNDPVEVQAISTKYTRIGFPLADSDKNLKLQIGEINGPKTTIDLNLL